MDWTPTFAFRGKSLYYNRIPVNNCSERSVEIPIAFDFLSQVNIKNKILEIGNVLYFYENGLSDYIGIRNRRIVDKFEQCPGVENIDLIDLPSNEKYDAIVSVSTVEHIGQGIEPSVGYGEQIEVRDLEAPLKAIAKIYDLLKIGGKALITVPFGKLIDGKWYVQFSAEYLELLVTKYGIPKNAISKSFLRRVFLEPPIHNPFQIWREAEENQLGSINYNWAWPCANSIAIIELNKIEKFFIELDVSPTSLPYSKAAYEKAIIYLDLVENEFLNLLKKCKVINLIFCPDWQKDEDDICSDLYEVIKAVLSHPDQNDILLFIEHNGIYEEKLNFYLASITLNLLMEEDMVLTDESAIYPVGNLSQVQWEALKSSIQYRLVLKDERESKISNMTVNQIQICELNIFKNKRIHHEQMA